MGGSMGVTQGLLAEFGPERVRNTPISEMAIVGAGIGAAMQGMRPVVEIMYEDFTTLAMEQLVNQAAKHRYMSGGQLNVPLTVRTQGGAGWSPGAQHAQQVEAWFCHVPGPEGRVRVDARGRARPALVVDLRRQHRHLLRAPDALPDQGRGSRGARADPARPGARPPRGHGRDRRRDRPARARVAARPPRRRRRRGSRSRSSTRGRCCRSTRRRSSSPSRRRTAAWSPTRRSSGWASARRSRPSSSTRRSTGSTRRSSASASKFTPMPFAPVMENFVVPARRRRARRDPPDGRAVVASEVMLPRLGQGMESGTIVRWLKAEGDPVEKGDPLYELDTDKVTQEVEAEAAGVLLKIVIAEGEVPVGTAVGYVGEAGENVPQVSETEASATSAPGETRVSRLKVPPRRSREKTEPQRPKSLRLKLPRRRSPERPESQQTAADQGVAARASDRARAWDRPRRAVGHRPRGAHRRRGRRARRRLAPPSAARVAPMARRRGSSASS